MPIDFNKWINPEQFSNLNELTGFDEKTGMQGPISSQLGGQSLGGIAAKAALMGAVEGAGTEGGALGGAIAGAKAPFQKAFDTFSNKANDLTSKVGAAATRMGFDYTSNLDKIGGQ
jgi:hypothetical protein